LKPWLLRHYAYPLLEPRRIELDHRLVIDGVASDRSLMVEPLERFRRRGRVTIEDMVELWNQLPRRYRLDRGGLSCAAPSPGRALRYPLDVTRGGRYQLTVTGSGGGAVPEVSPIDAAIVSPSGPSTPLGPSAATTYLGEDPWRIEWNDVHLPSGAIELELGQRGATPPDSPRTEPHPACVIRISVTQLVDAPLGT
jgi:hypothetical protein